MDEKELVIKIKNSIKAKQNRVEITRKLQQQGYKLEYIDKLIKKARRPKKIILLTSSIIFVILIFGVISALYFILPSGNFQKIENPLKNFNVNFGQTNNSNNNLTNLTKASLDEIEITPEFFTYLLNELGANSLKKNPITQEAPIINFEVGKEQFYSTIKNKIESFKGTNKNPDLTFKIKKENLIKIINSETPIKVFKAEVEKGTIIIEQNQNEQTLFLKGYISLYNSLNGQTVK